MEEWSQSFVQALIHFIKNPLLYWAIVLSFFVSNHVYNAQRKYLGKTHYHRMKTWFNTFTFSLLGTVIISMITLTFGFVLTYEIIVILSVLTFILTIGYRSQFLSASFILGFTYLLMIPTNWNFFHTDAYYLMISMTGLIGLFLLIEAYHLKRIQVQHLIPEIHTSHRGAKIGTFSLEKLLFIPFFIFVPGTASLLPFLPVFSFGDSQYTLVLVPFIFGFYYRTKDVMPQQFKAQIAKQTSWLGIIVILGSIISLLYPVINYAIVAIAIIGKLFIQTTAKMREKRHAPLYLGLDKIPRVFWVERHSVAETAGLQIGDRIIQINELAVDTPEDVDIILNKLPPGTRNFLVEDYLQKERSIQVIEPIYNHQALGIHFID